MSTVLVLYSGDVPTMVLSLQAFGLQFKREQHGQGPEHWAAQAPDGTVIEVYPASDGRPHGTWNFRRPVSLRKRR